MTYLTNREAALHLCNGGKLEYRRVEDGAWVYTETPAIPLSWSKIDRPSPYRAAVETFQITVRGVTFDVPEPVREPLEVGQEYWLASVGAEDLAAKYKWKGDYMDMRWLHRGLVHRTKEAAVIHGQALCGVV